MLIFPDYALKCISKLNNSGFEAYFVGGCVRDLIYGRECNDFDITTSALPNEVMNLFENTVPTGIKHGTVTVIIDNNPIEITTFRTENNYEDSRHPSSIDFVKNINEDLKRRDFTINALAYNPSCGLIDLFCGKKDLKNKIIKTVGNAEERFNEDALRILRAYRFSSVLGFNIEENTKKASLNLANKLSFVSGERVYSELSKLIYGQKPECILDLLTTECFNSFGIGSLKYNKDLLLKLKTINTDIKTKFALFICMCEHDLNTIKNKLHIENKTYQTIKFLKEIENASIPKNKYELKKFMCKFGPDKIYIYLNFIELFAEKNINHLIGLKNEIESNFEPYLISHLCINGQYLSDLGLSGKEVGNKLENALDYIIKYPEKNTVEDIKLYLKI